VEPAIVHAFEIANRAGWTEEELDELEKREMWIGEQRHILELARAAEQKAREAKQKGRTEGKAETLLRLLRRRFHAVPPEIEARVLNAGSAQLDEWFDRILDAKVLADVINGLAH